MLTIKHISPGGHEGIQQAKSVSFTPARCSHPESTNPKDELIAFGCFPDGGAVDSDGVCRYGDGIVYVMNDHGSTVAQYYLN